LNFIITKAYISYDGGWFMDGNALSLSLSLSPLQEAMFTILTA
jgi:hypothetical protein